MIIPELKSIFSPDLEYGQLPNKKENCSVFIELTIGPKDKKGEEIFSFTAITPKFILDNLSINWGRGYLILKEFSWEEIEKSVTRLLNHCSGKNWDEVSAKLNKELRWEFENYQN